MARTRRKKHRTHVEIVQGQPGTKTSEVPRSFVMKRGKLGELVKELSEDVRHVMEPHTARNLKETKANKLKDFVQVSGPLGISHFMIFSATERSKYLKICRAPRGPTLTFRVHKYTLAREVAAAQRNPRAPPNAFLSPPLVVLNNFGDAPHQKLATITFQNLFPPINVRKVKLSTCQRAVLIDYDKATGRFQFRHYTISAAPTGANRRLRKLLTSRAAPDLGALTDVSDFFKGNGGVSDASDSEGEDAVNARVDLAQDYNRVAHANTNSRVILQEVGPRMELELMKVEEGMCEGRVLYHAYVHKTEAEVMELEQKTVDKEALRKKRREEQEGNVRRKAKDTAEKAAIEEEMVGRKRKREKRKDDGSKFTSLATKKGFGKSLGADKKKVTKRPGQTTRAGGGGDDDPPPFKRGRKGAGDSGGGGGGGGKFDRDSMKTSSGPPAKKGSAADRNKRPSKQARAKQKR
jgi:ribosome biogenesis protein SSF1/2